MATEQITSTFDKVTTNQPVHPQHFRTDSSTAEGGKQVVKICTNQPVLSKYLVMNSVEEGEQPNVIKLHLILLGNQELIVIPRKLKF